MVGKDEAYNERHLAAIVFDAAVRCASESPSGEEAAGER